MKKIVYLMIFLTIFSLNLLAANSRPNFEIGFYFGSRSVASTEIKDVYGNGTIYFPEIAFIWHGIILGGGYEGGYTRNGKIGIYQEPATLKVTGLEFFLGYEYRIKQFSPYLKIGYGLYSYKQTVDSPYVSDYKIDGNKGTITLAGGLKVYPLKNIFISGELRYVPLKVKPYTEEVDLSGLRIKGGIGVRF